MKNNGIEIGEGGDKVNIVYFDSQKDAYAALQNSSIDAASVYSPYASLAKGQGYKVVYYCSEIEELKNQPCCRQVASTAALEKIRNRTMLLKELLLRHINFLRKMRIKPYRV